MLVLKCYVCYLLFKGLLKSNQTKTGRQPKEGALRLNLRQELGKSRVDRGHDWLSVLDGLDLPFQASLAMNDYWFVELV